MPKPILCGKCGTSSDVSNPFLYTAVIQGNPPLVPDKVSLRCSVEGCGHWVGADSLPAALAKFEEKVSDER